MSREEPIAMLENRVERLLDAVRRLKQDNVRLQEQVKRTTQQLTQKKNNTSRWTHDRTRVEVKVRKLLSELDGFVKNG